MISNNGLEGFEMTFDNSNNNDATIEPPPTTCTTTSSSQQQQQQLLADNDTRCEHNDIHNNNNVHPRTNNGNNNDSDPSEYDNNGTTTATTSSHSNNNNNNIQNSWDEIANNHIAATNDDDDNDDTDMVRHWKASPFAVGLTHATWSDEYATSSSGCSSLWNILWQHQQPLLLWTACCCRCTGRVGNMIVLWQRIEVVANDPPISTTTTTADDTTFSQRHHHHRPRLMCVMGPYWMICLGLTIPLITTILFWTCYTKLQYETSWWIQLLWIIGACGIYMSLFLVSCSDPGILYRHTTPPTDEEERAGTTGTSPSTSTSATSSSSWVWNDQALTYRPFHAKYDSECAAVIENYDHTCPWTGTAIGKNNMIWFRSFLFFVLYNLILIAVILTFR